MYFLATKDEAFGKFCEWKTLVENQVNKKVKCLRTDNGLEFCNSAFDGFCKQHGIERHRTCAYTPQQNGVAERMNRTIMEKVRCLLNESGLEENFWAEAVATSVYLINRTPSSANDGNIPEQLWLDKEPGYLHLRRFGSVVYVHVDQGKLKPRALKGVFIGYPQGVKGYKVWLIEDRKCVVSRNAVFTEDKLYKDLVQDKKSERDQQDQGRRVESGVIIEEGEVSRTDGNVQIDTNETQDVSDDEPEGGAEGGATEVVSDSEEDSDAEQELANYQLARDRSRRTVRPPARYQNEDQVLAFALSVAEVIDSDEPETYQEALRSGNWVKWEGAFEDEMDSLMKNHTWNLVKRPEKQKVIGCRWILTRKPGIPGVEKPRFKTRLVAKGYSQK